MNFPLSPERGGAEQCECCCVCVRQRDRQKGKKAEEEERHGPASGSCLSRPLPTLGLCSRRQEDAGRTPGVIIGKGRTDGQQNRPLQELGHRGRRE